MMFALLLLSSAPTLASATCDATPFTLKKTPPTKTATANITPAPKVQPVKPKAEKPKAVAQTQKPKSRVLADCDKPAKS